MFLAIRGKPIAWIIVIIAQSVFIAYVIATEQWIIFIAGQPLCLLMGVYGTWRWLTKGVTVKGSKHEAESVS